MQRCRHIKYNQFRYLSTSGIFKQKELKIEEQRKREIEECKPEKKIVIDKKKPIVKLKKARGITVKHSRKESSNSLLFQYYLEGNPTTEGFVNAVEKFKDKNTIRQGHIDFITTGMKFIEAYGLEKSPEVYEALMDVFPRNRFRNLRLFDAIFPKQHPQMFLALDILTKMEWQGITPSERIYEISREVFGKGSLPLQKISRMWFWFEEFKDINIYRLPEEVYKNRTDIIKAAVDRLYGTTEGINILQISDPIELEDGSIDYEDFLISSQTPTQQKYVSLCIPDQSLYIEGPTHLWINHKMEKYFVLKSSKNGYLSDGIHMIEIDEQREGLVLAMSFATKPYLEKMQVWLKHLQETNPNLKTFNVIFNVTEEDEMTSHDDKDVKQIESVSA